MHRCLLIHIRRRRRIVAIVDGVTCNAQLEVGWNLKKKQGVKVKTDT